MLSGLMLLMSGELICMSAASSIGKIENGFPNTPVLIVGAGPVGLALALDLARRGIASTVIEKTDGSVNTPKLGLISIRTMEYCRRWGIADAVRSTPFNPNYGLSMVYCTTIAGHFLARLPYPSLADDPPVKESPERKWRCPQLWFNPLLERCVRACPEVHLIHRTQLDRFEVSNNHVVAHLVDLVTNEKRTINASYMVGCDGAGSDVRRQLGIRMEGKRTLDYSVAIFLRSKALATDHELGDAERFFFLDAGGWWGNISAMDGRELWRLTVPSTEKGVADVVRDAAKWVRRALGTDRIPFEILSALAWRRSELSATHFQDGRVLIAGDACHTMSPTGGFGMNTGMGDVDNLGWKLAADLQGWGGRNLIKSYSIERQPIGVRNAVASSHNYFALKSVSDCSLIDDETPRGEAMRAEVGRAIASATQTEWETLGVHLGFRYEGSPIIVPDGSSAPEDHPRYYTPTARPGHRAPHAWIDDGSKRKSMLDYYGEGFVLLRLGSDPPDVATWVASANDVGMPLRIVDVADPAIAELYACRLALVRPDGHSAWRGDSSPADVRSIIDTVRGEA